jgi:hypothetical protein
MVKTRRQKKMRGGGKGVLYITWTLHGDQDEKVELNEMLQEWEEGEWDTATIQDTIATAVEKHVADAGYVKDDRHPRVVPSLDAVEVKFNGQDGPAVPAFDISVPGPDGMYDFTATFKLEMSGGRKTRGKKSRKATKKARLTRRR